MRGRRVTAYAEPAGYFSSQVEHRPSAAARELQTKSWKCTGAIWGCLASWWNLGTKKDVEELIAGTRWLMQKVRRYRSATRYLATTSSSRSTPKPGSSGTAMSPSMTGKVCFVNDRRKAPCSTQYSK